MRQETNNEIDLLLRRLSRRQGAPTPDDHLDADELSSYAENALPAAARARYTEHLAECSRCRELVVQLSSSIGVVTAEKVSPALAPSGLRKFLASLFSPMVLRYAVPALGLIVVAVIGLAVFRRGQRASTEVAQVRAPEAPAAAKQEPEPSYGFSVQQEKSVSRAAVPEVSANRSKESEPPPPPNAAPAVTGVRADVKKADEPSPPKAEEQPVAVSGATPTPVQTADTNWAIEAEGRKQAAQVRVPVSKLPAQRANEQGKSEDKRSEDLAAASPASERDRVTASKSAQGRVASVQRERAEKDRDDAETRSVAGRRFRKQGGVWVDTAYDQGATTNLTRGSEQYRSLIADEPSIKTIADQLDGKIIVVWKSRAYRIQ